MKKKIIIISILIILVVILLLIPKDVYQKIFKKNQSKGSLPTDTLVYQTMYVKNSDQYLVGIKVGLKSFEEDEIGQKWDILTKDVALIPSGYSSPIASSTSLIDHSSEDGILTLSVTSDFLNSDGRLTIECLAWNFCNDEIKEVVVKIDDVVVNEINNYSFNKISKAMGVNITYDTLNLFTSNFTTIIFHQDDIIKPVTFFFKDSADEYEYVINKILSTDDNFKELLNTEGINYELVGNELNISVAIDKELNKNVISTLTDTFKENTKITSVIVSGTNNVLLKLDFTKE